MDLEKNELVGDGEEDDMMISGGKILGIDEVQDDIENPYNPLPEELRNLPPPSPFLCIYRVPERLREGNEKAYTPRVVSIGPIHHGQEHLKAMEEHKLRYLRDFLCRTRLSFDDCIKMIENQEGRLRASYAEPIEFCSDQFVRIVLADAAFVVEFLLRYYFVELQGEADCIFNKPMMVWDVRPDLVLLENQLPFFILQDLFNRYLFPSFPNLPSLLEISYISFVSEIDSEGKERTFEQICSSGVEVQHFVDLIRNLYLPLESKPRAITVPKAITVPNVTELLQVEVKFGERKDRSDLFDIKFSNRILEIPRLTIDDTTNRKLRNLVAFEQCHCREENYLSSYVFLMKRLTKTPEDVELLVENKIIENCLGDTKKISSLLHDLGTGVMVNNFYYAALCEELNKHYTDGHCQNLRTGDFVSKFRRYKWKTTLRKNYFDSPWSIISVVAAVILLVLTFIQTLCSVKSIA